MTTSKSPTRAAAIAIVFSLAISGLMVLRMGVGGSMALATWLYVTAVILVVGLVSFWTSRIVGGRFSSSQAALYVASLVALVVGTLAGWVALSSLGGPVRT